MKSIGRRVVFFGLLGAIAMCVFFGLTASPAKAAKPGGGGQQCPRPGIFCTMQYDPVICSNGVTYSNACVAFVNCATGCVPTGGGGGPFGL